MRWAEVRQTVGVICAVGAWGAMGLSAYAFRPIPNVDQPLMPALILLLVGGLLLGVSIWLTPKAPQLEAPTTAPLTPARLRLVHKAAAGAGAIFLLLAAETSASAAPDARIPALRLVPISAQFNLWCAGILLLTGGLGGVRFSRGARRLTAKRRWADRLPLLLLAAIFALGLYLRVWISGDALRTTIDEIPFVETYNAIRYYNTNTLFTQINSRNSPYTWVYPYLQTLAVNATERSWAGIRLPSAIIGAVAVLGIYLLAEALFDRKTALLAALLLATFPPHMHFSRLALLHIADATFGLIAVAFTLRGLKHNRRLDWAAAGAALGLTQYFFEAGRLFFLPLIVVWLGWMLLMRRGWLRAHLAGLSVMLLVAVGVAMPVYYTWISLHLPLFVRFESSRMGVSFWDNLFGGGVTLAEAQDIVGRFLLPLQLYVHLPETIDFRYYGGQTGMILPMFVPVFLTGMAYLVWRWRAAAIGVVFWVVLVALSNGLLRDSLVYPRYVTVFAAMPLVLAVGLRYGVGLLLPGWTARALPLLVGILALVIGGIQARYYFGVHLQAYNTELRAACDCPDAWDALLRAALLPPQTEVYFFSSPTPDVYYLQPLNEFLRPGAAWPHALERAELTDAVLAALPPNQRYAFFVQSGSFDEFRLIGKYFRVKGPLPSPYANDPYVVAFDKQYLLFFAYQPQPRTTGGVVK